MIDEEVYGEPITPFTMDVPLFGPAVVPGHTRKHCEPEWCAMHNPSDHHMKDWPLHWRTERVMFERICKHGVGHPDPDDMVYQMNQTGSADGTHGCDGCCHDKGRE